MERQTRESGREDCPQWVQLSGLVDVPEEDRAGKKAQGQVLSHFWTDLAIDAVAASRQKVKLAGKRFWPLVEPAVAIAVVFAAEYYSVGHVAGMAAVDLVIDDSVVSVHESNVMGSTWEPRWRQ